MIGAIRTILELLRFIRPLLPLIREIIDAIKGLTKPDRETVTTNLTDAIREKNTSKFKAACDGIGCGPTIKR